MTTDIKRDNLKLGSLGGPNTFGAEAAQMILERYPIFAEIVYRERVEEIVTFDVADALCAPQQMSRTGPHSRIQTRIAVPDSKLYVIAQIAHPFHCSLLVKPGTPRDRIRRVLGHTGSITQSRDWLRANVPQAEIINVDTSSMGAAAEVSAGDGSTASIGTARMAKQFALEERDRDIDGGSVGSYWALSPYPIFSERPTRLVVAGRLCGDARFSELVAALYDAGFWLQTEYSAPTGARLYESDYVLRFSGAGVLSEVQRIIARFAPMRLGGAFESSD